MVGCTCSIVHELLVNWGLCYLIRLAVFSDDVNQWNFARSMRDRSRSFPNHSPINQKRVLFELSGDGGYALHRY